MRYSSCFGCALLLVVALLSGCAAPNHLARTAPTLAEVNRALDGVSVTLTFTNGAVRRGARDVVLSPDSITYRYRGETERYDLVYVQRIVEWRRSDVTRGALIGATPGLVLTGLAGAGWATCEDVASCVAGPLAVAVGGIAVLMGGVAGGKVGSKYGGGEVFYDRDYGPLSLE